MPAPKPLSSVGISRQQRPVAQNTAIARQQIEANRLAAAQNRRNQQLIQQQNEQARKDSEEKYRDLTRKTDTLNKSGETLNTKAEQYNDLITQYNTATTEQQTKLLPKIEQAADQYNTAARTHQTNIDAYNTALKIAKEYGAVSQDAQQISYTAQRIPTQNEGTEYDLLNRQNLRAEQTRRTNLYNDLQKASTQYNTTADTLKKTADQYNSLAAQFAAAQTTSEKQRIQTQLEKTAADYNKTSTLLQKQADTYNKTLRAAKSESAVDKNTQTADYKHTEITTDTFNAIIELEQQNNELNTLSRRMNETGTRYNDLITQYNTTADTAEKETIKSQIIETANQYNTYIPEYTNRITQYNNAVTNAKSLDITTDAAPITQTPDKLTPQFITTETAPESAAKPKLTITGIADISKQEDVIFNIAGTPIQPLQQQPAQTEDKIRPIDYSETLLKYAGTLQKSSNPVESIIGTTYLATNEIAGWAENQFKLNENSGNILIEAAKSIPETLVSSPSRVIGSAVLGAELQAKTRFTGEIATPIDIIQPMAELAVENPARFVGDIAVGIIGTKGIRAAKTTVKSGVKAGVKEAFYPEFTINAAQKVKSTMETGAEKLFAREPEIPRPTAYYAVEDIPAINIELQPEQTIPRGTAPQKTPEPLRIEAPEIENPVPPKERPLTAEEYRKYQAISIYPELERDIFAYRQATIQQNRLQIEEPKTSLIKSDPGRYMDNITGIKENPEITTTTSDNGFTFTIGDTGEFATRIHTNDMGIRRPAQLPGENYYPSFTETEIKAILEKYAQRQQMIENLSEYEKLYVTRKLNGEPRYEPLFIGIDNETYVGWMRSTPQTSSTQTKTTSGKQQTRGTAGSISLEDIFIDNGMAYRVKTEIPKPDSKQTGRTTAQNIFVEPKPESRQAAPSATLEEPVIDLKLQTGQTPTARPNIGDTFSIDAVSDIIKEPPVKTKSGFGTPTFMLSSPTPADTTGNRQDIFNTTADTLFTSPALFGSSASGTAKTARNTKQTATQTTQKTGQPRKTKQTESTKTKPTFLSSSATGAALITTLTQKDLIAEIEDVVPEQIQPQAATRRMREKQKEPFLIPMPNPRPKPKRKPNSKDRTNRKNRRKKSTKSDAYDFYAVEHAVPTTKDLFTNSRRKKNSTDKLIGF